jgi:enoyl-CoA hydratase/carnithine racemase
MVAKMSSEVMVHNYKEIVYEVKAGVALITLNRPERLNAWTATMERSIKRAIFAAAADAAVRVIVVTGAGRGFCAGADMALLQGLEEAAPDPRVPEERPELDATGAAAPLGPDVSSHYNVRFGYLMSIGKPIIAAINGACAGVGLVFTLYCDLRFASEQAQLLTAFAKRGLIAEHGCSWLLPRLIGPAHALDLLFSARTLTGAEAERIGLVNRAFAPERFMAEVLAYAGTLVETVSPRSMAVIKAQVWKAMFQDLERAVETADWEMAASFASADFTEGVAHFVEKRAPRFPEP